MRAKTTPRESLRAYLIEHRADLTGPAFESYMGAFGLVCRGEGEQEVYDEGTEMRAYAGEAPSPAPDGLAWAPRDASAEPFDGSEEDEDRERAAPNALDRAEWSGAAGLVLPDSLTPEERADSLARIRADRLAADGREHDQQVKRGPGNGVPVVCAWKKAPTCYGHIRGPKPTGDPQEFVSHGMCAACFSAVSHEQAQERGA